MKYLRWGDKDPRCVWGSKNLRWGSPASYLLQKGDSGHVELQPGDIGYVPPEPKPKPKRRTLRLPRQQNPNTPHTDMLPYQFITRTGTQNQVTTARVTRGTKTTAEVHAEVTARIGATPVTVPLVIKTFLEVVLDWETEGWTIEPIEDLLGFFMPCGGSFPDTEFQPTFENMNHSPASNLGDVGRARVAGNITKRTIPTAAVGLIREAQQAEEIVANGHADMVLLAREMLRDPYWTLHAARQLGVRGDWPVQYGRAVD